jgi:hypothetical protein
MQQFIGDAGDGGGNQVHWAKIRQCLIMIMIMMSDDVDIKQGDAR